jgi:hypothetical protein
MMQGNEIICRVAGISKSKLKTMFRRLNARTGDEGAYDLKVRPSEL